MNYHQPNREISYVEQYLSPLRDYLVDDGINELSINHDGSIFVEVAGAVHMEQVDVELSPHAIKRLGAQLAGETRNTLGALHPIVSGRVMVWGNPQRVQVVIEPAIEQGVSLSIRKYLTRTLNSADIKFVDGGRRSSGALSPGDRREVQHPHFRRHLLRQDDGRPRAVVHGGCGRAHRHH
jgi:type IV secretion system protein VirB11